MATETKRAPEGALFFYLTTFRGLTAGPVNRFVARSPTGLLEKPIWRLGCADISALRAVAGGFLAAGEALASGADLTSGTALGS
jgi:hypothetical protein